MTFWQRLFGPSQVDRVLDVLKEDRAASAALTAALIEAIKDQTALTRKQLDLLTAPTEPPKVRVMTRAHEAEYEKLRQEADNVRKVRTVNPDTFLASTEAEFAREASAWQN